MKKILINIGTVAALIFTIFYIIEFAYQQNIQSDMLDDEEKIEYYIVTNYGKHFEDVSVFFEKESAFFDTTKNIHVTLNNYKEQKGATLQDVMDDIGDVLKAEELKDIVHPENYGSVSIDVAMHQEYDINVSDNEKKSFSKTLSAWLNSFRDKEEPVAEADETAKVESKQQSEMDEPQENSPKKKETDEESTDSLEEPVQKEEKVSE